MGNIRPLADPVVDAEDIAGLFRKPQRNLQDPFPVNTGFNRLHGADRRAAAAEVALLLAPEDLPGQILRA